MEEFHHDGGDRTLAQRVAAAIERLTNAQRGIVQDLASRNGLSPLQTQTVLLLAAGAPPTPRASTISRELGVSEPTLSETIGSLKAKGLVDGSPDPDDRRASTLRLTPRGRQIAAQLESAGDPIALAVAALPVRAQAEALRALLAVIGGLAESGIVGVARTCLSCRFHEEIGARHRCSLLGLPLPTDALRVNCAEHERAAQPTA